MMLSKPLGTTIRSTQATAIALALVVATGLPTAAADVDPAVKELQQAVLDLKQKVEQQDVELERQAFRLQAAEEAQVIAEANAATRSEDATAGSGLSGFLEAIEIDSWINVNYAYNSRGNGNNHQIGQNSNTAFHQDSNTVQVDQIWFQFDKPVNNESRAGFHTDIAFGETARSDIGFGGNDADTVYTAYVSYLAPLGYSGIQFDAGEVWTLLGAEAIPVGDNWNITRGLVWNLQPTSHTGVIASTLIGPVSLSAGFVNAVLSDTAIDSDRNKALTGRIAYEAEAWSIAGAMIWGSQQGELTDSTTPIPPATLPDGPFFPENNDRNEFDLAIFDLLIAGDPTPELSVYFNFDYVWAHPGHGVPNRNTYGASVAARFAVSEVTGLAARFDVVVVDPSDSGSEDEYAITTTIDRQLTDELTLRGEMRFDWGIDGKYKKAGTPYSADRGSNHQNLFLIEAIYSF
ncbi:MAG: outer membrane beta-barrel protein [Myxococcota bacterium]